MGFVVNIVKLVVDVDDVFESQVFIVVVYFESVEGVDVDELIVVVRLEDGVEFYMIVDE